MKRGFKVSVVVALLAGAVAVPVLAQNAPGAGGQGQGPGPGAGAGGQMMRGGFDFARFDSDGDGKITAEEVKAVRAAEAAALDADGNGKLTLEELMAHEMRNAQARAEARVKARIAAQDVDGDGALSAAEMAVHPMPTRMFDRMDADGDGAVSLEEAQSMRDRMRGEGRGFGKRDHHGAGRGMMQDND